MLKYTICFIKKGDKLLLINRQSSPWMGIWNGVGGKLEEGETPYESIVREVYEETGLQIDEVTYKGTVTWEVDVDGTRSGGMYAFMAEVPEDIRLETPKVTEEGILDWKEIDWILHEENVGVASNIPYFLPIMLYEDALYEHHCTFQKGVMVGFFSRPLLEAVETK